MTPPREVVQPSSKKVKTETVDAQSDSQDWYSSRQYQRHESTWYNSGNQANDSEEVKEEVGPQALPVEPPPDFSNVTKGKGHLALPNAAWRMGPGQTAGYCATGPACFSLFII